MSSSSKKVVVASLLVVIVKVVLLLLLHLLHLSNYKYYEILVNNTELSSCRCVLGVFGSFYFSLGGIINKFLSLL